MALEVFREPGDYGLSGVRASTLTANAVRQNKEVAEGSGGPAHPILILRTLVARMTLHPDRDG